MNGGTFDQATYISYPVEYFNTECECVYKEPEFRAKLRQLYAICIVWLQVSLVIVYNTYYHRKIALVSKLISSDILFVPIRLIGSVGVSLINQQGMKQRVI